MDSIVSLEDEIRKAFVNKESVIAVFLYIERRRMICCGKRDC